MNQPATGRTGDAAAPASTPVEALARWRVWFSMLVLLVGLHLVGGTRISLSNWQVDESDNMALAEALAWRQGRLALDPGLPTYETAEREGNRYNVVGPLFTMLCVPATWLTEQMALAGADEEAAQDSSAESDQAPSRAGRALAPWLYVLMVAIPLPFVAFWAFRSVGLSPEWSAVMCAQLILGTAMLPVLEQCCRGVIYTINHVLATMGLLLVAGDLLGRRRWWVAALGFCMAAWSRQMTVFYALPFIFLAWRPAVTSQVAAPGRGRTELMFALVGVCLAALLPMTLNWLKFRNPLETGYPLMYRDRTDWIAQDARACFYGPRNVKKHLMAGQLSIPGFDIRKGQLVLVTADVEGASIWLTTPLLLAVPLTVRRWWHDPARRWLLLTSLLVMIALTGYFTTSARDTGFYRYSLDFIPIWVMVIAPYVTAPRWRYSTVGALAWSALYFSLVP